MSRLQSAMEYLMTYGWAILVIAVVLGALYSLGVFNSANFAPRAQPGACEIFRPDGPNTNFDLNLEGMCNGELPEYVFKSRGVGDYIYVPGSNLSSSLLNIEGNLTITAWVEPYGSPYHDIVDKEGQYGMKLDYNNLPHPCSPSGYTGFCLEWDSNGNWTGPGAAIPNSSFGKWMFLSVSIEYNATTGESMKYWYANGQLIRSGSASGEMLYSNTNFTIGAISRYSVAGYGDAEWFNGSISNIQVYNTALSANDIKALYLEGIGGAPVDLQNLVAWYPLNGNANDYSGNGNNGVPSNVIFSGDWYSGYTIP
ncbi:MAG: LamG-like jellyroll fold domain-containing protein [Candidatus Micrarchaeaceae archaeon]